MPTSAHAANQPIRGLFRRLLQRITTLIIVGASLSHSICPVFAGNLGHESRRPNIVFILADDK